MHPIVAIGGETTGTALRIGEETLELDLRGLRRRPDLDQLAGQRVRITGTLSVRKGVELTTRSIVRVTRIARVRDR